MPTRLLSIGILAFSSMVIGAGALALDPEPFDASGALVVLAGVIIAGLTGVVGLTLARAPWGRWVLLILVLVGIALASIPGGPGFWVTLAIGAVAIVGLLGPWIRLWIRHEPAAEAPGPVVIALMAVAPAAPLVVGIVALWGFHPSQLVLIAVATISSWAYGRGVPGGIWGLRIGIPLAGIAAAALGPAPGGFVLAIAAAAVTIAAWLPHARRATAVITPPLPEPVQRSPRSETDASD